VVKQPPKPMLAVLADAPLEDPSLVYEPKYDGIRAIIEVADGPGGVRIWSRNGNEKTAQFPEIVAGFEHWLTRRRKRSGVDESFTFDGEIVALDAHGQPLGFQALQGRIHAGHGLRAAGSRAGFGLQAPGFGSAASVPVAFIAFDLLHENSMDLRGRPLVERRARLEKLFPAKRATPGVLRLSEIARGDGQVLHARAIARGWEGVIAKRADSIYHSGKRTPDWRKIKITHEQEFVIGGWTEPRGMRSQFGALMLGVWEERASGSGVRASRRSRRVLRYVGHVGTGFNERELARVSALLRKLEINERPFSEVPPANDRPHWVRPELVAQVRFTEWTAEGFLRHPVYLGLRDDKKSSDVVRETKALPSTSEMPLKPRNPSSGSRPQPAAHGPKPEPRLKSEARSPKSGLRPKSEARSPKPDRSEQDALIEQLNALEESRKNGWLQLADGTRLAVTNLHKVFWPKYKRTKGDLFRYYVEAAPFLLPALADRPLVMKRFPNGIAAQPFYQHRVADAPKQVRIELVPADETRPQIIGGSLLTLLYTTQLAAISQDPWFSRMGSLEYADHFALDLDPMPGVPFARALDVAQWLRDELEALGATGVPKTSGADGLHIYVPLPPGTPYEAGVLFCQIVAAIVAARHPQHASTERMVKARGKTTVYVDCLQNVYGRTLASAYSARASEWAGVSTPLSWDEVEQGIRREDFSIETVPARLKRVGDLWAPIRRARGVDLERAVALAERRAQR
jgi:bifunctional non-homologous end joining protein LigD